MSTREVILDGGSPWGFRMHGGADVQQPLRISRVNPGSKAAQRGIREGDFISSINGQTTRDISNSEAHSLLRNAGNTLTLGLNQENLGSPKRRTQKLSQEAKEDLFKRSSITSTSSSTFSNISTINRILTNSSQSNETLHTNGIHKHTAEEKYSHPASDYSSYVKNGSTSSRGDNTDVNVHQLGDNAAADLITIMADNSGSSRSRRQRRSRNKKSKNKQTPPCIPTVIVENPIQEDDANSATASSFVDKPEVLVTNCDKVESVKQVNEEIEIELISEQQENTVNLNPKQINSVNITSLNNVSKIENSVECNPDNEASIVIFKPDETPEETTSNLEPVEKRKSKRNKKRNTKFSDEPKETGLETDTVQIENISRSTYEEESKNNVEQVEIIKVDRNSPENENIDETVKKSLEDTAQSNKINEGITVEEIQAVPETNIPDNLNNEENVIQSEIKIKKKRSRKESKRTKTSESESTLIESTEVVSNTIISEETPVKKNIKNVPKPQEIIRVPYRVESPKTVIEEEKKSSSMVKSRSLDDDDLVKITEITEDTTQSKTSESTAIVSEAESDVEWETVSDLDDENSPQHFGKLSVISLPLEEHRTFEPSNLSPEDERGLRDFLQGLDLVSSPEESVKRIDKPSTSSSTSESTKTRKAKKRAALIQHFMPYYQNPRFLDVISEEGSDLSDKDCRKESIRRAIPPVEDDDDDVFEDYAKEKKMRERYQENMSQFRPILVDTKLIDSCKHTVDATWSTAMAETQKGAELVYLEDSSNSMTPSDLLDLDETVDADDEDEISLELDKSFSDSYDVSLNKNDPPIISSSDTLRESLFDTTEQIPSEVTAPSLTPVNNSTANDTDFAPDITKPSNPSSIDLVPLKDSAVVETSEKQDANNTNVYKINENFIKTNIIDFINTILDESVKQVENNDSETIELNNQITTENVINSPDEIKLANSQNTVIQEIKSEQQDAETLIENDEELNKELKNLCDSLRQKTEDEYSSRSESVNSACSSRSTSQSTTIYNPAHSSLTNIATMLREGSAENKEPNTLRELCVRQLLSMPFGKDVIEELANVSKSIEEMIYHTPFPLSISNNTKSSRNNQTHPSSVLLVKPQKDTEKWVQSTMDTEKLIESLTQFEKCTKKSGDISKENWKETPIEKQTPNYIKWSQNNTKKSPQIMNESENIRIIPIQIESTEPKQKSGIVRIIPIQIEPRPENKSTTPKNKTVKETENWVKIPIKIDSRTQKEIDLDIKPKIENKNTKEIPIKIEKKTNAQEELEKWKQHVKENTKEFEKLLHNSKTTNCQKTTENWTTCTTKTEKLIQNTAKKSEKWIGMPTEVDPKLLVCLSPAQKDFIDKTKTVPKEADSLLDLHKKFIERRGYNDKYESFSKTISKEPPTFQVKLQPTTSQNNLLKIIKDSSETNKEQSAEDYLKYFSRELRTPTPVPRGVNEHKNIRYNEYIKQLTQEVPIQVERTINKPVNNKIYTAALLDNENNRLNARHLGEWLNLARNTCDLTKSKLVTQQSYDTGMKQPEFTKSKSPRRYSLPFNLYEKQMQYILEKEREIEREIEKLRVEKDILEKMEKVEKIEESKLNDLDVMNLEEKLNKMDLDLENRSNKKELHTTTIFEELEKLQTSNLTEKPMKSEAFHKSDNVPLQSDSEKFRQEMYNEYMSKIAERQERKENKVIKIKISTPKPDSGPSELSPQCELKLVAGIEDEFMSRVKERMDKLGLHESSDEDKTSKEDETASILIMDGSSIKDTKKLPKHIQEFVDLTRNESVARRISRILSRNNRHSKLTGGGGSLLHEIDAELIVARGFLLARGPWTPAKSAGDDTNETVTTDSKSKSTEKKQSPPPAPKEQPSDEPIPVVWTPRSAGSSPTAERKEFRPVNFESPVLSRKNKSKDSTPATTPDASVVTSVPPPWIPGQGSGTVLTESSSSQTIETSSTLTTSTSSLERRLTTSQSAPVAGLNNLSKLPRAQNPTITLLQKAREGQLPRGASYIEQQIPQPSHRSKDDRLPGIIGSNEILYTVKNEYMSESDSEKPKKMANLGPRKFEGIGPTTKDGMPIVLRSEVKDVNQAKWYKQMYDTLHRAKNDDEYVTVRYKTRRGRYPYASAGGYLSEPEPMAYDSDAGISASKYATLDRRRLQQNRDKENEYITYTVPRNKYMSASVKHSTDIYKNQPGRIENYVTGHSSISDKEAKEWWDEVMEIFDGWLDDHSALPSLNYMLSQVSARSHLEQQKHVPPQTKSYMSHALKESGYESDSTLVFRRREDAALQLNPHEQKEAYKTIQKGGEVPLHGLRKLAPERPKDETELEYFPISPTLTRIRIHKSPRKPEVLCYPVNVQRPQTFSTFKRSAPSTVPPPPKLPTRPPSPPKRRSSRNSHTLRLISTMTIHSHSPKPIKRHETCFKPTCSDRSNVKFLRDRISCKLKSPTLNKKGFKVTKTISTYPSSSKESIITTLSSSTGKDSKTKIKSKTDCCSKTEHHYSRSTAASTGRRCCRNCSFSVPPKIIDTSKTTDKLKPRGVSLERTFGSEKRKVELTLPKLSTTRLVKSPDLLSPTEVKKVQIQKQKLDEKTYPPGTTIKKSTSLFSSAKNGISPKNMEQKSLDVTVAISAKGKELLNSSKSNLKLSKSITPTYLTRLTSRPRVSSPSPDKSRLSSKLRVSSPSPDKSRLSSRSQMSSLSPSDKSRLSSRSRLSSPSPSDRTRLSSKSRVISPAPSDKSKLSQKSPTLSVASTSPILRKKTLTKSSTSRVKISNSSSREELQSDREKKRIKKTKKDQSNEELKSKKLKTKEKNKKCHGRAGGTEIVKKLKKIEDTEITRPVINLEAIEEQHKNIFQTDSFFQHLFLRDFTSPTPSVASKGSFIIEKTKMLQNPPTFTDPTVRALKVYLSHRRPVSESKFKALDQEIIRSRSVSPSTFSRSLSEHGQRFDSISEVSNEDSGYEKRSISSESIRSRRSTSLPASKIIFSETSRAVSPSDQTLVRYRKSSPSTSPIRSPSRRKIHNMKPSMVEGVSGLKKKTPRARSAGDAESLKRELFYSDNTLSPSVSSVSLSQILDPNEYKTYVTELRHSTRKCDRFKELNNFYSSLERLSELERTTSSTDLRPRRKNEDEIIDYDRWKQVRTRERAEQEFNTLYKKLRKDQKEKDLLFRPKDVENYKWKYDREFGLKVKEQSVESIKEQFENLKESPLESSKRKILEYQKDVYKPLWRGSSVLNIVSKISGKSSQVEKQDITTRRISYTDNLLTREFGSKLWSSLSVEQVNTLKNQLAEIYSQAPPTNEFSINVDPQQKPNNTLTVRRNSVIETPKTKPTYVKSSSIGAMPSQTLSENEKKRLSLSLSQEVQDKISQKKKYKSALSIVLGKETRGAIASAQANIKPPESTSPRTCYSLEPTEDDKKNQEKDFLLVLTKDESEEEKQNVQKTLEEWSQPKTEITKRISSTSETESASSDTSTKTAIFMGKKEDLHKKIEYFEKVADVEEYIPTIHRPAEDVEVTDIIPVEKPPPPVMKSNLVTSQSYADLKELFGEKDLMKFATIPLSATRKPTRKPLLRATNISPIRTVSEASSSESIYRSRSLSPESKKFWNTYMALINGVDVQKMTEKFENLKDFYSNRSQRRSRSDSDLQCEKEIDLYPDRSFGDVYWLKKQYESRGRSRTRRNGKVSPILKSPLKAEDRLMPHINIISKLASLYPKKLSRTEKQKSIEELARALGCPVGEVEKIREKFESPDRNVSLLGHMFTSSPNVHELRDIAPYLAGPWIAHQYPRLQDNTRSLSAPEDTPDKHQIKKDRLRPKSASPSRSYKPILKSHHHHARKDIFANQHYDPKIHRPAYRYQPDRGRTRSWSPKHTVTFKEPSVMAPTPPPKGIRQDYNGSESPRKYVEDEVTIHYRSPVRHEIKEMISEEELARKQAEAMRRIYQEERRRKYLQELQDMNSRRHTDNFIPSQKSPISLNRYDDFIDDLSLKLLKPRDQSPEPRLVARALYNFVGQSSRELTFRKGDVIFIRRQVDKNWYEGEHNAMIGLFPSNYVEIVPYDGIKSTPRKAHEGQARAKFNFIAQTHLELSLAKGELVVLTRRIDDNWFEGRIGTRKGIFPVSYVEILIDPSEKQEAIVSSKPVASPAAHSLLLNGSSGGKESMGSHHYQPSYSPQQQRTSFHAKPVNVIGTSTSLHSLSRATQKFSTPAVNEALHIDTHSEPVPYRALYKYKPQNDDELELLEGDTVYVLEKCDDGWYVGSSQRTGAFGTFPGNYVERI